MLLESWWHLVTVGLGFKLHIGIEMFIEEALWLLIIWDLVFILGSGVDVNRLAINVWCIINEPLSGQFFSKINGNLCWCNCIVCIDALILGITERTTNDHADSLNDIRVDHLKVCGKVAASRFAWHGNGIRISAKWRQGMLGISPEPSVETGGQDAGQRTKIWRTEVHNYLIN